MSSAVKVSEKGQACLRHHKFSFAFAAKLCEGFTSHVLYSRMGLMHELEKLVDNRLQELPVVSQKSGVLAHHIPAISIAKFFLVGEDQ